MAELRNTRDDREWDKFDLNSLQKTAVRVIGETSVTDTTPPGYSSIKYLPVEINDSTWTLFTAGLDDDTGAVGLQNDSGAELRFRHEDTEPGYVGWRVLNNGEVFFDIETTALVYVKSGPGTGTRFVGRLELLK